VTHQEMLLFIVSEETLCFVFHQLIGRMPVLQKSSLLGSRGIHVFVKTKRSWNYWC